MVEIRIQELEDALLRMPVPYLLAEPENCLLHNESGNYLQSRQMRHLPLPQVRQMMIGPASFMI
ncbi:hypothetical protein [Bradyrhizobium japonicum]|uniref:hypothetical protein n=1 Tax=Bradyrhizobium japonicum TaxID=375 RepID=UPI0004B76FC4|nr:hypothetical protein [Bradyrhizobium japonicum]